MDPKCCGAPKLQVRGDLDEGSLSLVRGGLRSLLSWFAPPEPMTPGFRGDPYEKIYERLKWHYDAGYREPINCLTAYERKVFSELDLDSWQGQALKRFLELVLKISGENLEKLLLLGESALSKFSQAESQSAEQLSELTALANSDTALTAAQRAFVSRMVNRLLLERLHREQRELWNVAAKSVDLES